MGYKKFTLTGASNPSRLKSLLLGLNRFLGLLPEYYNADYTETDQGAAGGGSSIKDFVDDIGTTKNATLFFKHHAGAGNTTTYTLTTSETIPSNITVVVQPGVRIDGAGTLTVSGPFEAGLYQVFGSSITVAFGSTSVKEFHPEWWGIDGTADEVQINLASVASGANGGIVRLAPKDYNIAATINVYDGVRLLGQSDGYNASGTGCNGTVIVNSANVPAITVAGEYGFEIAYLHIYGNDGTDDGIYLVQSGGNVPRSSTIHNISMNNIGRDGVRLDGFSYMEFRNVLVNSPGAHGFNVLDVTATPMQEYLQLNFCRVNSATGDGLHVTSGHFIYVNDCDFALCDIGVFISGDSYHVNFRGLSCSQNTTYGIEIHADTSNITRLSFKDTDIHMKGTNATEKAIYTHRTAAYTIQYVHFDWTDISKNGATAPTLTMDFDTTFAYSKITNVRDSTSGTTEVSFPTDQNLVYTSSKKIGQMQLADEATPTILGGKHFRTGGTTTITDFDDGYWGQVITVLAEHSVTITDGTNIYLNGSANFDMTATDTLSLICDYNNKWYEMSRGDNGA